MVLACLTLLKPCGSSPSVGLVKMQPVTGQVLQACRTSLIASDYVCACDDSSSACCVHLAHQLLAYEVHARLQSAFWEQRAYAVMMHLVYLESVAQNNLHSQGSVQAKQMRVQKKKGQAWQQREQGNCMTRILKLCAPHWRC